MPEPDIPQGDTNRTDNCHGQEEQKTVTADTFDGFAAGVQSGFAQAHWCGERGCEDAIKEKTGATARCMPLGKSEPDEGAVCTHCGKKAVTKMYFAKAY